MFEKVVLRLGLKKRSFVKERIAFDGVGSHLAGFRDRKKYLILRHNKEKPLWTRTP